MDAALPRERAARAARAAAAVRRRDGIEYHALRTRQAGAHRFVSCTCWCRPTGPCSRATTCSSASRRDIRRALPPVTVYTHLEPLGDPAAMSDQDLHRARLAAAQGASRRTSARWPAIGACGHGLGARDVRARLAGPVGSRNCGSSTTPRARATRNSRRRRRSTSSSRTRATRSPASRNTRSSPSASAWRFTAIEPGTQMARTPGRDAPAAQHAGRAPQVGEAAVGARADERGADRQRLERLARAQAHVRERPLVRLAARAAGVELRHAPVDAARRAADWCPR